MAGRLDGKVCVITGAGGGMGREAAIVFTAEGAKVCVADVDQEIAEETVSPASFSSRSATHTFAPSAVNTMAASRPIPPPAPVMTHTFPSSLPIARPPWR